MKSVKNNILYISNFIFFFLLLAGLFSPVLTVSADSGNVSAPRELEPIYNSWNSESAPKAEDQSSMVRTGVVAVSASLYSPKGREPYQGIFNVCGNKEEPADEKQAVCWQLQTNKWGQGKIWVPSGSYTVYPPFACPPDYFCPTGDSQTSLWSPISWKVAPSSFRLFDRSFILIKSVGIQGQS